MHLSLRYAYSCLRTAGKLPDLIIFKLVTTQLFVTITESAACPVTDMKPSDLSCSVLDHFPYDLLWLVSFPGPSSQDRSYISASQEQKTFHHVVLNTLKGSLIIQIRLRKLLSALDSFEGFGRNKVFDHARCVSSGYVV